MTVNAVGRGEIKNDSFALRRTGTRQLADLVGAKSSCTEHAWENQGTTDCHYPEYDLVLQVCAVCGTERLVQRPCQELESRITRQLQVSATGDSSTW